MKGGRVAVAMSGGVDSSVAAAVLAEQGYEVVGVTMRVLPGEGSDEAVEAARGAAEALDIPHHVFDLREPFERMVVGPFCEEYARGRTPNPCIRCNAFVKLGLLRERAEEIGAEKLATGHYARVGWDEERGRWALWRAVDRAKDQSYSLYDLRQEQLARALFPLGGMRKAETRARAAELGLSVAEKPDSQQICFVSSGSYGEFLSRRRPEVARPGPIVDREGRQLGRHRGIAFYTIGQRQGLRVARGEPLYVVEIDAEGNRLVVGGAEELRARGLVMGEVNYVSMTSLPKEGHKVWSKIRYGARLAACTARPEGEGVRVEFVRRQRAVTPGQAAVCYEGEGRLPGEAVALGGTIESAL